MRIKNQTFDLIAIVSTILCAIHCAALPILLSFSTLSSLHFLGNPLFEWAFIVLALVLALISLWPSYQKIHKSNKPLKIATIGFVLIAISRFIEIGWAEASTTVMGALLISYAHYVNWQLLKRKKHSH